MTFKGLALIDPDKIKINELPPPVVIEQVIIDDHSRDLGEMGQLPPGQKKFEFHYTGLSFLAPEKVKFRYKLEGLDKDWVEAGTREFGKMIWLHLAVSFGPTSFRPFMRRLAAAAFFRPFDGIDNFPFPSR